MRARTRFGYHTVNQMAPAMATTVTATPTHSGIAAVGFWRLRDAMLTAMAPLAALDANGRRDA
ncbi:MAG: hypothetical protein ACREWJ_02620 [Rhodoferax sp.]